MGVDGIFIQDPSSMYNNGLRHSTQDTNSTFRGRWGKCYYTRV